MGLEAPVLRPEALVGSPAELGRKLRLGVEPTQFGREIVSVTAAKPEPGALVGDRLRSALAFNFGAYQLTGIIGPALGGLTIAALGVGAAYALDVASCFALVAAALAIGPQRPTGRVGEHDPIFVSIREGLRFVRSNNALDVPLGKSQIDLKLPSSKAVSFTRKLDNTSRIWHLFAMVLKGIQVLPIINKETRSATSSRQKST